MSKRSVNHFSDKITQVIEYFAVEYDMSYAEIVGALQIIMLSIANEAIYSDMETE